MGFSWYTIVEQSRGPPQKLPSGLLACFLLGLLVVLERLGGRGLISTHTHRPHGLENKVYLRATTSLYAQDLTHRDRFKTPPPHKIQEYGARQVGDSVWFWEVFRGPPGWGVNPDLRGICILAQPTVVCRILVCNIYARWALSVDQPIQKGGEVTLFHF